MTSSSVSGESAGVAGAGTSLSLPTEGSAHQPLAVPAFYASRTRGGWLVWRLIG